MATRKEGSPQPNLNQPEIDAAQAKYGLTAEQAARFGDILDKQIRYWPIPIRAEAKRIVQRGGSAQEMLAIFIKNQPLKPRRRR